MPIINSNNTKKRILIYHTHTTEAFKPAQNDSFYEQYNIVGVGDVLKREPPEDPAQDIADNYAWWSAVWEWGGMR